MKEEDSWLRIVTFTSHFLEIFPEIGIGPMSSDNQKYLQKANKI